MTVHSVSSASRRYACRSVRSHRREDSAILSAETSQIRSAELCERNEFGNEQAEQ